MDPWSVHAHTLILYQKNIMSPKYPLSVDDPISEIDHFYLGNTKSVSNVGDEENQESSNILHKTEEEMTVKK